MGGTLSDYFREIPLGVQIISSVGDDLALVLKFDKNLLLILQHQMSVHTYPCIFSCNKTDAKALILAFEFRDDPIRPIMQYLPLSNATQAQDLYLLFCQPSFPVYLIDAFGHVVAILSGSTTDDSGTAEAVLDSVKRDLWLSDQEMGSLFRFARYTFGLSTPPIEHFDTIELSREPSKEELLKKTGYPVAPNFVSDTKQFEVRTIRFEPGITHELEIATALARVFPQSAVYHSPTRLDGRVNKEICDILVAHDDFIIVVQAKDSPNTIETIQSSTSSREHRIRKQVEAGINQLSGAVRHIKQLPVLDFCVGDDCHHIDIESKQVLGLVVVSELYTTIESFNPVLDEAKAKRNWEFAVNCLKSKPPLTSVPTLVTDFPALDDLSRWSANPVEFIESIVNQSKAALETGHFRRWWGWESH